MKADQRVGRLKGAFENVSPSSIRDPELEQVLEPLNGKHVVRWIYSPYDHLLNASDQYASLYEL